MPTPATLEAGFFRTLNAFIEPIARAGCLSPGISPTGVIVLETTGRRSGHAHRTPVFATLAGDCLVVGTARGSRSQWIENARATPEVSYWLDGRAHQATALVFKADQPAPDTRLLPPALSRLAHNLQAAAVFLGAAFAILVPDASATTVR